MLLEILAFLLNTVLLNNGQAKTMAQVIGGTDAIQKDWYFMVSMYSKPRRITQVLTPDFKIYDRDTSTKYFKICGGVIVTQWHILTAAHCMHRRRHEDVIIRAGSTKIDRVLEIEDKSELTLDRDKTFRFVHSFTIHQNYSSDKVTNDIGIVKITLPFTLS